METKGQITTNKNNFLIDEIWLLTFGGAFQRSKVYTNTKLDKTKFRNGLRSHIENLISMCYHKEVNAKEPLNNINTLITKSIELVNPINFGVAQKLLNLHLKYLWCLNKIPEPPHFPVDRRIQEKLNEVAKDNNISTIKIEAWTKFKDHQHYDTIIAMAKDISNKVKAFKDMSPAQLELKLFKRQGS